MILLFVIFHILAVLAAMVTLYSFSKQFKIEVNIHNLPIIIMGFMAMLAAAGLSLVSLWFYIPTGIIVGILMWWINSMPLNDLGEVPTINKLKTSLLSIFFWPQLLFVIACMFFSIKKIYEKSEH